MLGLSHIVKETKKEFKDKDIKLDYILSGITLFVFTVVLAFLLIF